jgi:hypothetical protein
MFFSVLHLLTCSSVGRGGATRSVARGAGGGGGAFSTKGGARGVDRGNGGLVVGGVWKNLKSY